VEGERAKRADVARALYNMPELLRTEEAKHVSPVCVQHNTLAPDAGRGKRLVWWRGAVERREGANGALWEVQETWGRGTARVYRQKVQAMPTSNACGPGDTCPYRDADPWLSAPPGLDYASGTDSDEDAHTIGVGSFGGYYYYYDDDDAPGGDGGEPGALAQELAVGAEEDDLFGGETAPGTDFCRALSRRLEGMQLTSSSGSSSGSATATEEARPPPAKGHRSEGGPGKKKEKDNKSCRPSREEFERRGIVLPRRTFFKDGSRRAGQVVNVSLFSVAIDAAPRRGNLGPGQLQFLDESWTR
jgi:hypothetical protein